MPTILEARAALAAGSLTARQLVEACLEAIGAPDGQGENTFLALDAEGARLRADALDESGHLGAGAGPLAGIPISVKDLFNVSGEVTRAGSMAMEGAPAAAVNATVIQRVVDAGGILIGRTTMSEFAFSGLGLNPHYGTPRNPWDRDTGRVPGGSSSGAAVSVADGMALGALGSDTGGSCRIPAAFCGIVGFKPTQRRVPRDGVFPLSHTLDSIGPLAATVVDAALLDAVLAGEPPALPPVGLPGLNLPVLGGPWLENLDPAVAAAFERAVRALAEAGVVVAERRFASVDATPGANINGGFAPAEAYAVHRERLQRDEFLIDPNVRARILRGAATTPADLATMAAARARLIAETNAALAGLDALLLPTCPIIPPAISEVAAPEDWIRLNAQALSNCAWVNFLDLCAISLPIHTPGEAPVGLMLVGRHGDDRRLLAVAAAVQALLGA